MLESLTEKILQTLRALGGRGHINDEVLDELCRSLRINLLEADVHVKVVKDLVDSLRSKASLPEVKKSLNPEQQVVRILYQELSSMMGESATAVNLRVKPPAVLMVVGLQGSGKTTTVIKMANYFRNSMKKSVMVGSTDVYRPAAIEQLRILATNMGIEHFEGESTHARERAIFAREEAMRKLMDILILDTAGRLHVDEEMMEELQELYSILEPAETFLVLDAMTGQEAVRIGSAFQEKVGITGLVLTKLDGDARGGAALSLRAVTGLPIKFIGVGEKPQDLELFHPDRLASRILDMGDLLSLAEKARETVEPEEALKLAKKIRKNDFTLADFYLHLQQIKKMGSFETLMKFIPGMGKFSKELKDMSPPDQDIKRIEAIILSMTPQEREDHNVLDGSRRRRIAGGSGTKVEEINRLIKQFMQARKMMTRMAKSGMGKRGRMW